MALNSIARRAFVWHGFETLPDPHDEVFVIFKSGAIILGNWSAGYLYAPTFSNSRTRHVGPPIAWALNGETPTAEVAGIC